MSQPWKVILAFAGVFLAGAIAGGPLAFVCFDMELPRSVTISDLPLGTVELVAVSAMGAPLYRGELHPAQLASEPMPSATVTLYADAAR